MNPLMMLMSGCFGNICGGYTSCGAGMPWNTLGNIWTIAGMQTAMQCGTMGFGGIFSGGNVYGAGAVAQTSTGNYSTASESPATLKAQMEQAEIDYNRFVELCSKAEGYMNNTTITRESLAAKVVSADKNIVSANDNLLKLQQELATLKNNPLLSVKNKSKLSQDQLNELNQLNAQIQAKQAEIKQAEEAKTKAEQELENAKIELDAFDIAADETKEKYNEIVDKKNKAYTTYRELADKYLSLLSKSNSAESVEHDRAADSRESGKWWDRTVVNPENWFNKKGGLWGEDKSTPDANIAKCLRKLKKSGRDEALAYGIEQGLITMNNGVAETKYSELEGLVQLYNGRDKLTDLEQ